MDKKIILSIKGNHRSPEGEDNSIELITEGRLYKEGGVYYIEYEESEISGMEGTRTLIAVQDKRIQMERSGDHPSKLIFEQGKKFINSYQTPFGVLQMGIYSTKVDHRVDDEAGELDLRYQLDIGGRFTSTNALILKYNLQGKGLKF